jgi:hypothetical protein
MNFYSADAPLISLLAKTGANVQSSFFADWQIQPEQGKPDVNETLARIGEWFLVENNCYELSKYISIVQKSILFCSITEMRYLQIFKFL